MGKLRGLIPGILTAALLAGFAWYVLRPHEPVYQGKTLSVWLEEANEEGGSNSKAEAEAEKAIRALGVKALPVLVESVRTRSSDFVTALGEMAGAKELSFLHLPPQEGKRQLVVWAFGILGAEAKPAVNDLANLLDSKENMVAETAVQCLGAIGPEARDAVRPMVKLYQRAPRGRRGDELRIETARALGEVGPVAQLAIPVLSAATNDPDAELALIKIQQGSFLPFIERLRDTSNEKQWTRRANLIPLIRTNNEAAVPLLVAGLETTNENLHVAALRNLGFIHSQPEICVPAIIPFLKSTNAYTRGVSLEALRSFRGAAQTAVPEIERCLKDSDYTVQVNATNALRAIQPKAVAGKKKS
jgi:HEAT repeat protein